MAMDLSDPQTFRQAFEEHERGVHAAAMRILNNAAQAQDVVQDVFLRLWRRPGTFDSSGGEARVEDSPVAATERDDSRASVREALRQLPEPQREALVLAYWGGLTADQIAEREHVPLGTAKSRIRLGLQKLRQEFPALALEAA